MEQYVSHAFPYGAPSRSEAEEKSVRRTTGGGYGSTRKDAEQVGPAAQYLVNVRDFPNHLDRASL